MRAIRVHRTGGPEVLQIEEVADPQPGRGEVLVRLRAAGVNPVDAYLRAGAFGRVAQLPYTPGMDGAGEVVAWGADVSGRAKGERVYVAGAPTYAELVAAPAEAVWALPDHTTYEQGAAIGVPYVTAHLAIHFTGHARSGDRILVRGGSGGVGIAAIQIAVAHGCPVVATAGTAEGQALVRAHGATALAHDDLAGLAAAAGGQGYHLIVEMLANVNLASDLTLVADGGCVAVVGARGEATIDARLLLGHTSSVRGVMRVPPDERRQIHAALGAGLRNRSLSPVVGPRFPLAEAAAAHAAVRAPGAHGKIALIC